MMGNILLGVVGGMMLLVLHFYVTQVDSTTCPNTVIIRTAPVPPVDIADEFNQVMKGDKQ